MTVYTELDEYIKPNNAVVTVGTFDGLHRGHIKIMETMKRIADEINGKSIVVTFNPHPRSVISKGFDLKILTSFNEKKRVLENRGIDQLIVLNFTKEFSQLTSNEFIKKYLVEKFGTVHMVVGHDHKFGKDRLGDEEELRELGKLYNFDVTAVLPEEFNGEIISSTKIRNSLYEGDIEKANLFLGRNYSFSGLVVKGAQRGRVLGFPTANLILDDQYKAIPQKGVYIVACSCEKEGHYGIMNIGYRPTFENRAELVIEVHILNFDRDIYGKELKVDFIKRLRDEKRFESKEELIYQIEEDKKKALELINVLVN
ncbi:MAG: bifunctional riboflavin kinase/FAD synthetase [Melioribacteraceae bacterium]|nr:bifunctional riboflavin kinase/FAD synthetase [Melioribacteraceae bacterium]